MDNFPFSSVHIALKWYFSKGWIKPPVCGSSFPQVKIQISTRIDNVEIVVKAFYQIQEVLDFLPPRDWYIVASEFQNFGWSQRQIASRFDLLGGDRSVRFIRDRSIKKIESELLKEGIISKGRWEEPVYERESRNNY